MQEGDNAGVIGLVHEGRLDEVSLTFVRLLRQDVAVEGMLPLDFPGTGQLEPLLGT